MSWRVEWKAISDKTEGLLEAGRFFLQVYSVQASDSYGVIRNELIPHAKNIFNIINKFSKDYATSISPAARECLYKFINSYREKFDAKGIDGIEGLKLYFTILASFRTEFSFQISDISITTKRLVERAFIHLQRSIVADSSIRERWKEAYELREEACEKLGGAHLLLHGIWGFKASAEGERTDLVLGEPLKDIAQIENAAEALILTEWKVVRDKGELQKKINVAFHQAERYAAGILSGFELASYRYLVIVSENVLEMPTDKEKDGITYRHINIAVDPKSPSKT